MSVHQETLMEKTTHCVKYKLQSGPLFVVLGIVTFVLLVVVIVFNALSADPSISGGLFLHGAGNVSRQYPLNITPAGWAFSIWSVIYALQVLWNIYNLTLLCRTTSTGPAYLNPTILSPAFLIFFNLSSAFNIGWLFLWDRFEFLASFIFLAVIAISLILAGVVATSRLFRFKDIFISQGRRAELAFLQVSVVNGIGMYATWTTIATMINLGVYITYEISQPVSNETASIICLGIISFLVVVYVVLDFTVLEPGTRYCFTPFAVVIWAIAASVQQNYNPDLVSSIMAVVLLGSASLVLLVKLGRTFYNCYKCKQNYKYTV